MGQPITAVEKKTARPGVIRFDLNRSLTGMGHERYYSLAEAIGDRPCDELARRLFAKGGVDAVHIHGNEVTIDITKGADVTGFGEIIEGLYIHYTEGVQPSIP